MRTPPCRGELSTRFQAVVDPAIIASETRSCESTTQAGPQRHVAVAPGSMPHASGGRRGYHIDDDRRQGETAAEGRASLHVRRPIRLSVAGARRLSRQHRDDSRPHRSRPSPRDRPLVAARAMDRRRRDPEERPQAASRRAGDNKAGCPSQRGDYPDTYVGRSSICRAKGARSPSMSAFRLSTISSAAARFSSDVLTRQRVPDAENQPLTRAYILECISGRSRQ